MDPYFLKFAPADKKCLAYASSFGVSTIPPYAKAYYSEALKRFDAIGVREDAGVRLVKDLSGKIACWVLDPTLLLSKEEWLKVATFPCEIPQLEKGYILVYELTPCPYILQLARHVNEMLHVPVVRICKNASREDKDKSILNIVDAGPSEFVGLFAHAKFVITNSFHGTAFAINLERDFYTVTPLRKQNNSRQQSLLKLFHLEGRLIVEGDRFPSNNKLHIAYTDVRNILERERRNSIQFLMENCK